MGIGKVLLGVAIGVGAVAAAPFTGGGSVLAGASLAASLAGAGTIATAVGAGTAGAVAGAVISGMEFESRENERTQVKSMGFEDGLKKGEEQVLAKVNDIMLGIRNRDSFILALAAFCYAVANCDAHISDEELDELDFYLNHIRNDGTIPAVVKKELMLIQAKKAPFSEIKHLIDGVEFDNLSVFSDILTDIIEADEKISDEEIALKKEWTSYYEQRKH